MRTSASTYLAILTAAAQLTPVCVANWTPGKAAQINFYTDTACTQYNGEGAAWWNQSPMVGGIGSKAAAEQAQCITLNMPGNSKSINTAALWAYSTTTQPETWSSHCIYTSLCIFNVRPGYVDSPEFHPRPGFARKAVYYWLAPVLRALAPGVVTPTDMLARVYLELAVGDGAALVAPYLSIVKSEQRGPEQRRTELARKEIDVWLNLRHPNILPFLGANTLDDKPFIMMPYIPYNAQQFLQRHTNFDPIYIPAARQGPLSIHRLVNTWARL
ncbi:hypothetical protein FB451DRAFT_1396587 [Mycena latifolia]|nr:hypothetical protein FB451DRAFT_1396587 [Mycena latifolia]